MSASDHVVPARVTPDVRPPETAGTPPPPSLDGSALPPTGFGGALDEHLLRYFRRQRRFLVIAVRTLLCGLLDFPIVMGNNLATIPAALCTLVRAKRLARWLQDRESRRRRLARLLPPYRTLAVRWKLAAFSRMVVRPLQQRFPERTASLNRRALGVKLQEVLAAWEKVPTFLEAVLTPVFWLAGIAFLGLDPKTVFLLARDKVLYQRYTLWGRSWIVRGWYRIVWFFDDSVPWDYSWKFIAVGLVAYLLLTLVIEHLSVQYFYRRGAARRLLAEAGEVGTPS